MGKRIFLTVLGIVCVFPLGMLAGQSFSVSPGEPAVWQYWMTLFRNIRFYAWFWNSFFSVVCIIILAVPVSLLAGYGFSQFRFRGRDALFFLYIVLMLLPFQATIVPQYLTLHAFRLLDTRASYILPNAFGAFGAFLMTQYMCGIDRELLDAGRIDGLTEFGILTSLVAPLCRPAVSTFVILLFLDNWSMIEQPVVFVRDIAKMPLAAELSAQNFPEGAAAAGVVFAILPTLAALCGRDDLIRGISLSSLK